MAKITDAVYVTDVDGAGYVIGYYNGVFSRWAVSSFACNSWLSGAGVPTASIGDDSDYYLNTATGDIFKRSDGVWGNAIANIRGTDGATWHFGSGTPSTELGVDGDGYLDNTGFVVYRKTSGSWASLGSIKGIDGVSPKEIYYNITGVLTLRVGQLKRYVRDSHTISSIKIFLGTQASGSDIMFDIRKNGVQHSIFSTDATIPQGESSVTITDFGNASLSAGDYLTVDITQVGATVAGSDLSLTILLS